MFSRVAIPRLDKLLVFTEKRQASTFKQFAGELKWLLEQDLIFNPEAIASRQDVSDEEYGRLIEAHKSANDEASIRAHPRQARWRRSPNGKPRFTDAEVITIATRPDY